VAAIIWLADTSRARWFFNWLESYPGTDKAGHFVLIGGMAFMLNLALRRRLGPFLLGSVLVAIVFTCEEFSQLHFSTRHFDWGDLAADFAGIAFFEWPARRILGKSTRVRSISQE